MSGFEGREKEIADAIRAKLRERGIGRAEIRELAASRAVHRKDDSSGGGGGQRCREQYCDAFSDDPVLGPVTGSPEAGDIPKDAERNLVKKIETGESSRSCSIPNLHDCVNRGDYCAYECVHVDVFAHTSYPCRVPNPGDPVHCPEDFHCEDGFQCTPFVGFICDDGFECVGAYYTHEFTCVPAFHCSPPQGSRFMCSKSPTGVGFICAEAEVGSFTCKEDDWFSCHGQHTCYHHVDCDPMFMCEEYICGFVHSCPEGFDCTSY